MKLRSPWLIRLAAFLAAVLIRMWMGTVRFRIVFSGGERLYPVDPRKQRYLYAFWHETILFPTVFSGRVKILISQHADGELIAQACQRMRYGVIRGSTTRGATQALLQLCRQCRNSHLLVTPDGPRGPRRRVQPGLIFVASRTGLPVVPCGIGCSRVWRARSWDRFAVPWPFSLAVVVVAPSIHVPAELDRQELEQYRQRIEAIFLAVTEAAERLAKGQAAPGVGRISNPSYPSDSTTEPSPLRASA